MPGSMDIKSYILLVNREKKLLKTISQFLLDAGYPVLAATTMGNALNLLSRNTVALIISDTELEDFSGREFLRFLKSSPLLSKIPFVFFESAPNNEKADNALDAGEADSTVEEEVEKVLEAFEMGAADFIAYNPEEDLSGVLMERIGKMIPSMAAREKVFAAPPDKNPEPLVQQADAGAPESSERRDSKRNFLKTPLNIELSRDAILWMPGQVINISEQGLMLGTSLLGRLGMILYIKALLPKGKCIVNSRIKHISISQNQLSAEIGVQVETSQEWIEMYHHLANLMVSRKKNAAAEKKPAGKKIDVNMVKQADGGKTQRVDVNPLLDSGESRGGKALEIKFYRSLIGKQLGNYKAVSFIGAGSMGGVFKGWDVILERNVALKIISYNLSAVESYRNMFFQEARLVSRLTHPNIAQIYHIEQIDDVLFFAMELISGGTLSDLIRSGKNLHAADGMEYLITMCRTLDFVSKQKIVHRDIKPANIMINDQGTLKIVDFGVAIVKDETDKKGASEGLGSPLYVSPECIMGRQLDFRSDIYSLGATFYHIFTGAPPFNGDSVETILLKHLNEELVPIKKINPVLSSDLSDIIEKMLEKNPEKRYQSYQAIINDLTALKC